MEPILFFIALIAIGLALGGMVFFAAIIAPTTFKNLDELNAGKLIRAIFPQYYVFVAMTSVIGAIVIFSHSYYAASGLGLSSLAAVFAWRVLMPKINNARDLALDGDKKANKTFEVLHRASVWLNFLGLLGVIAAILILAIQLQI